jgi:glycosyltransferase involved in cell wall biosynthesis
MRVVALLAIRNEEYYLERCLRHLYEQGIETCLIDNGSVDRTLEIAESYLNRGVFRIEHIPFNGIYEWTKILEYKSQLAQEIDADWFIHHDADEVREAPKPFKSLVEGIEDADKRGYNAINSDEFVFIPTSDEESYEGMDYVKEMRYYYYFKPAELHRVNIWKKTDTRVDLASSGGHSVIFENRRIYPENFILRHYILLSKRHAIEKYGRRNYDPKELAKGWHGRRASFNPEVIRFPRREYLKEVSTEGLWDRSDPWREHSIFK